MQLTKNVGRLDRIIRLAVAVVIGILILAGALSGALAIILGILAIILFVTGLTGVCPLYLLLGLNTLKR